MKRSIAAMSILVTSLVMFIAGCGGGGGGGGESDSNNQVSSTVGAQGGTISITDDSSTIKGFKMVIPAGALSAPTTISVQTVPGAVPLPATTTLSGNIIELLPAGLTFSAPVSVTIPYNGTNPPTVVTYDHDKQSYSILPAASIDTQNKTVTVLANHFTSFFKIFSDLSSPASTGFQLGLDTFKINNRKEVFQTPSDPNPTGKCWGFSYYSKWYFENKKASDGNLYGKYPDEVSLVSAAQETQSDLISIIDNIWAVYNTLPMADAYTFAGIYNSMQINKTPQVLYMCDPSNKAGTRHAVLVYGITKANGKWTLDIYDSRDGSKNYPLIFDGLHFQTWQGYTGAGTTNFSWFTFVGDDAKTIGPGLENLFNRYKAYTMSGTIHSSSNTGAPLSGATVSVAGKTATTSPTGTFTIDGVPAGTYTLTVAKTGYITFTNAAFSVSTDMANQSFYLLQPINSTFAVTGTIHSASNSGPVLAGATVSFTATGKVPVSVVSDNAGVFTASGLQAGTYVFTVAKSGYAPYVNAAYSVTSNQTGVVKYLTSSVSYSMSGTVHAFDGSGMGLPGATVSLSAAGKSTITDTTDNNGAFLLTGIQAGTYVFSVSRFGWTTFTNAAYSISSNQGATSFYLTAAPPFGVLATNSSTGAAGLSWGYLTVNDAKVRALSECGAGCSAVVGYAQGTCVSFARGPASYAYSVKETHGSATAEAISSCNTVSPGCVEVLWGCN